VSPTERLEQRDIDKALDRETTGTRAGRDELAELDREPEL
jgi:hypothetical protein